MDIAGAALLTLFPAATPEVGSMQALLFTDNVQGLHEFYEARTAAVAVLVAHGMAASADTEQRARELVRRTHALAQRLRGVQQ